MAVQRVHTPFIRHLPGKSTVGDPSDGASSWESRGKFRTSWVRFLPPLTPRNGNSTEQNWISSLSKGIKRLEQYLSISLSPSIMEQWMRFVLAASYMSPSRKVSRLPFFWEGFACVGIVWVNGDHRDLHQQQRYTILERVYFWLHLYRELPVIIHHFQINLQERQFESQGLLKVQFNKIDLGGSKKKL